ncbi:unnamed protein product [Brachionus calyciflorus]|uniref:RING-type domain-containing protein n=1 Tax=Brachionus calyciflorus TaxID=104777 RepID=A0A814G7P2_9BILA|nr:unnamed protein product [Brachionus calyciflorus]
MNLENTLVCPICNLRFDTPIILPCGETICAKCITTNNSKCFFCNKKHSINQDNMLINKLLVKQLNETFKVKTSKYESDYNEIIKCYYFPKKNNDNFFQPLIDHLVQISDMKIQEIENNRNDLLQKLNAIRDNNLTSLDLNNSDLKSTFDELTKLFHEIKSIEENMIIKKEIDDSEKYEYLRSKFAIKIDKFYKIIRNYKQTKFLKNSAFFNEQCLGLIVQKDLRTINFNEYQKASFLLKCTDRKTLKVQKINKKHFIFTYLEKNLTKCEKEYFNFIFCIEVYLKTKKIKTAKIPLNLETEDYLISNYDGNIYLYFAEPYCKKFRKLNSYLEESKTAIRKTPLIKLFATKNYVFGISTSDIEIFDHNLVPLKNVFNSFRSLINFPSKLSNFYSNCKFIFVDYESQILVLDNQKGILIKYFNLKSKCEIVSVSDENVITAYNPTEPSLDEINLNGEVDESVQMKGFPSNLKIILDENENLEFFEINNLDLYY